MTKRKRLFRATLLGLLLAVVIPLAAALAMLVRGVSVASLAVSGVHIEQLSVRLQRKLVLDVERITIPQRDSSEPPAAASSGVSPNVVRRVIDAIDLIEKLFATIDIRHIQLGDMTAQFSYSEANKGHLRAQSPLADIALDLSLQGETLLMQVQRLLVPDFGVSGEGWIKIDTAKRMLLADLSASLAGTLPVSVQVEADRQQLTFSGQGEAPVSAIAPVVDLFKLGPSITPWISEYLRASEVSLQSIRGTIPYADPAQILQTLFAEILVKDTEYTFAQGLEPVYAPETLVVFERGVLGIYPTAATFYEQDAGNTYVDIDFNDGRFLLTVFVRTRAQASGGILTLLEHYGIPFPFEQVEGLTDTELDLTIDLATVDIQSKGHFLADNSVFKIGQQRYAVEHLDIGLNTRLVLMRHIDVAVPGLFSAVVGGVFNAGTGFGELDIDLHQFIRSEADTALELQANRQAPLRLSYQFRPEGDQVQVASSRWRYGQLPIAVGKFDTPFDPTTFAGSLSNVTVDLAPWLNARVSGAFQGSSPYAQLQIAVLRLGEASNEQGLQLGQSRADIDVLIDESLALSTQRPVALTYDGLPVLLQPFRVKYTNSENTDGEFRVEKSRFQLGVGLTSSLQGNANLASGDAQFLLDDFKIRNTRGQLMFAPDFAVGLDIAREGDLLHIESPKIGLVGEHHRAGAWSFALEDIAKLYPHSRLLQQVGLKEGSFRVFSPNGDTPYNISGTVNSPFGLIVEPARQEIDRLRLSGTYDGEKLELDINDKVQIAWRNSLRIKSADIGYSWPALKKFIDQFLAASAEPDNTGDEAKTNGDEANTSGGDGFRLSMQARKSFIDIDEDRRIPLDAFSARYAGGKASLNFYHRSGVGSLDFVDGQLYLAGKGFSNSFFDGVFTLAEFDGGRLEFSVDGAVDDLQAVFRIRDTIIKDYKHLNNMLAFVNTIPGLITFNPPDYNNHGLPAREAYAGMTYKNRVLEVESMKIDSDELSLMGSGYIDFNDETTDMNFNMVSGAKKSINRIPLLGYILTGGEEKPSISLKVQGNMYDPEISNTAFKEVVTYPFQVLKRTVLLPAHIVEQVQGDAGEPSEPPAKR
jgi:hypothetical protein